ncbi:hypothetical protein ACFOSW_08710 [Paenibacillus sp. GCM10012303]|jgi:hypothetical protein
MLVVLGALENGRLEMKTGERFASQDAAAVHRWVETKRSTDQALLRIED